MVDLATPASLFESASAIAPEELVAARSAIPSFCFDLPAITSIAAYECRLASDDARVDYSFCVRALPIVGARLLDAPLHELLASGPHDAHGVRAALVHWVTAAAEQDAPVVWVEVDAAAEGATRPFVVYTLSMSGEGDAATVSRQMSARAARVLRLPAADPRIVALARIVEGVPREACLRHVALRPKESSMTLRAIFRVVTSDAIAFVPGNLPGCARAMDEFQSRVLDAAIATNLNLDVGPEAGDRFGLEFHFEDSAGEEPRWQRLFDQLESRRLLCPRKRSALESWPTGLGTSEAAGRETLSRDLMVKVDFDSRGAVQAKAYLVFGPRDQPGWASPGTR